MNADLRAALERHQVMPPDSGDADRCDECALVWPCDASRALEAWDAAEQKLAERNWPQTRWEADRDETAARADLERPILRLTGQQIGSIDPPVEGDWFTDFDEYQEFVPREVLNAAEAKVAALVEALNAACDTVEFLASQFGIAPVVPKWSRPSPDLSTAAAEHDARVAREAVEAERERLLALLVLLSEEAET